ncbi:MAG: Ldh family oxidoreductase [Planctomycetaceae bacterium]
MPAGFFAPEALREFVHRLLIAAGAPPEEALVVAGSLVESNLRGHDSHGVVLARWYLSQMKNGQLRPGAPFEILHQSPAMVAADGHLGFGQVQCPRLVDAVTQKARALGVACGTLVRSGHVGRLGEWVERAGATGLASLLAVNDNGVVRTVAPPGGLAARLSTNPIAIAVPTGNGPLVLDISTSAVANGKLRIARLSRQQVPLGWIQDAAGNPSTDPHVLLADQPGSLLPFGGEQGYKGFGLGLLFDILASGLSGGFCPPARTGMQEWNNVLVVVWDPGHWAGCEHLLAEADKLIGAVRDTPRKPGVDRIRLPGDRSTETKAQRLATGVPVAPEHLEALASVARKLHVPLPDELPS